MWTGPKVTFQSLFVQFKLRKKYRLCDTYYHPWTPSQRRLICKPAWKFSKFPSWSVTWKTARDEPGGPGWGPGTSLAIPIALICSISVSVSTFRNEPKMYSVRKHKIPDCWHLIFHGQIHGHHGMNSFWEFYQHEYSPTKLRPFDWGFHILSAWYWSGEIL